MDLSLATPIISPFLFFKSIFKGGKENKQDLKVTSINSQSGVLIKDINKDKIKDYLNSFVASNIQAAKGPLLKYISKREDNELNNWDVFLNIPSNTKDTLRNLPRRKIKFNDKISIKL